MRNTEDLQKEIQARIDYLEEMNTWTQDEIKTLIKEINYEKEEMVKQIEVRHIKDTVYRIQRLINNIEEKEKLIEGKRYEIAAFKRLLS